LWTTRGVHVRQRVPFFAGPFFWCLPKPNFKLSSKDPLLLFG
jgi:hypothetical protein